MATLQLKPVTGYHREELLDDGGESIMNNNNDSINIMFPRNVTSIGNPHFSNNLQLIQHEESTSSSVALNDPFANITNLRSQNLLSSPSSNDMNVPSLTTSSFNSFIHFRFH